MRISIVRCGVAAAGVVLMSSCAGAPASNASLPDLDGTAWVLVSLPDRTLLQHTEVTLQFANGSASGSAGCNRYHGGYQADGTKLTFGPVAATRRACAEAGVMEQEQQFLGALQRVATARVEGDRLELRTADGALAVVLRREGTD